ncbi:MAG TPA: FAD-dependent monooxygenase [Alphaproteobacteria bacterium]|jgi:2-polyprenyl-6-methoxyphenol hydroxylase-like FAD-dependent oxidoreductase
MATGKHALIIGGSLGGLFAASLLRKIGWTATIFERSKEALASRGAGLGTTRELAETMRRAGARLDVSMAVPMSAYVWLDAAGRVVHLHPRQMASSTWSRVYAPLRETAPDEHYLAGKALERVDQRENRVIAQFVGGATAEGDLLIAADGNQSTVRRQLMPEVEARYAGYVAWRGIMEERDVPPAIHRELFDKLAFSFPAGEMALAMPVPGPADDMRPGHRRYYFIWYRPADAAALDDLCTDERGLQHGVSIPPPLIRPAIIRALKERAGELIAPDLAAVIRHTPQPLLQAISDLESPRLVAGRVVLLGDAAFVARPHVAAGVTKAALDAAALADALAEESAIETALARYERERLRFGNQIVAHGRKLGTLLDGKTMPRSEWIGDDAYRDPLRVLRDYGAPHLVHDMTARDLVA